MGRPRKYTDAERKQRHAESERRWLENPNNRESHNATVRARAKKHPEREIFRKARTRAAENGVPFDLELSDIVIPEVCPILGVVLTPAGTGRTHGFSPSLDRFKPELGYVKGNISVISWRANRLKNDATLEEVKKLLDWREKRAYDRN